MPAVVAPLLHTYVPPPEAISVTEAPEQMIPSLFVAPDVSESEMDADGTGMTVMVEELVAVHPPVPVTVTVYVVVEAGDTLMEAVVEPLLQL
jgi:hypothetical protein